MLSRAVAALWLCNDVAIQRWCLDCMISAYSRCAPGSVSSLAAVAAALLLALASRRGLSLEHDGSQVVLLLSPWQKLATAERNRSITSAARQSRDSRITASSLLKPNWSPSGSSHS